MHAKEACRAARLSEHIACVLPARGVEPPLTGLVGVLDTGEGTVLIDAGLERDAATLRFALAQLGGEATLLAVLLTHLHGDHAGGALGLHRACGARLHAHPRAVARLADAPEEDAGEWELIRCDARPVADGEELTFGHVGATCLHTPGHTGDSLSFIVDADGQRCAFIGDLVMEDLMPGWRGDPAHSLDDTLRSLERIAERRPDRVCTGHQVIYGPGMAFLERAIAAGLAGRWTEAQ